MMTCTCSHVEDEHNYQGRVGDCLIEGCLCIDFEWDGEEVGESE